MTEPDEIPTGPPVTGNKPTGWTSAAMWLGILAVLLIWLSFNQLLESLQDLAEAQPDPHDTSRLMVFVAVPILAIILGFIAKGMADRGEADGKGMALAGIILGFTALATIVIFFCILMGFNALMAASQ